MKPRVKKVKTKLVGKSVPHNKDDNGTTGRFIEDELEKEGHIIDRSESVPDLIDYEVEVKSRLIGSKSPWTIGSMNRATIENTPYEESLVYKKIQNVLIVDHNNEEVRQADTYPLYDTFIQDKIKEAYEKSRKIIIQGGDGYVRDSKYGYFEKIKGRKNQFKFRIPDNIMKDFKMASAVTPKFNEFFKRKNNDN